jgi:putative hemolysin
MFGWMCKQEIQPAPRQPDPTRFDSSTHSQGHSMRALQQAPPSLILRAGTLEVRLATTFAEIDAALRLRFEVFNLELREGLAASYERGFDQDAYDAWCDHLIVRDLTTETVVGTYRLLRGGVAARQVGFYSETEFDLENLKRLPGEALELGRSCVAQSQRSFATINLLWKAIVQYAARHDIRYLFGCASLHRAAAAEVQPLYAYLRQRHFAPDEFRVTPLEHCRMPLLETGSAALDERAARRKLPPLLKGYLRTGALVCGAPAFDAEFGTADVLMLMRLEQLAERYQQHYGFEGQQWN